MVMERTREEKEEYKGGEQCAWGCLGGCVGQPHVWSAQRKRRMKQYIHTLEQPGFFPLAVEGAKMISIDIN